MILAVDPGTEKSAWVLYDRPVMREGAWEDNDAVLSMLRNPQERFRGATLVVERVANQGQPILGDSTFATSYISGRFREAWAGPYGWVKAAFARQHITGHRNAKAKQIRAALVEIMGAAYPTKSNEHIRSALAVAITWDETRGEQ